MDMEMEVQGDASGERLLAAAVALEAATVRVAAVDLTAAATREAELAEKLAAAEATIVALRAGGRAGERATGPSFDRKTAAVGTLIAKDGGSLEGAGLDAALVSLSVEQRIAVKAGLMRSGLL